MITAQECLDRLNNITMERNKEALDIFYSNIESCILKEVDNRCCYLNYYFYDSKKTDCYLPPSDIKECVKYLEKYGFYAYVSKYEGNNNLHNRITIFWDADSIAMMKWPRYLRWIRGLIY